MEATRGYTIRFENPFSLDPEDDSDQVTGFIGRKAEDWAKKDEI